MVYAVVRHVPDARRLPGRGRCRAALALPGVERVVRLGPYAGSTAALAVVGAQHWHAQRRLRTRCRSNGARRRPARSIPSASCARSKQRARKRRSDGFAFHSQGDGARRRGGRAARVEAVYRAPYLAHATMEPINCTARSRTARSRSGRRRRCPAWRARSRRAWPACNADAVTVHVTYLGGGFGRRLDVDFVGQAVRVALETDGRPVQLVWPREEDITHDFYRPAGVALLRAGSTAQGSSGGLRITSAGRCDHAALDGARLPALAGPIDLPDKTASEGLFDLPYAHRAPAHRACGHAQRRAGRFLALGRPFAQRVLLASASSTSWRTRRSRTRWPFAWRC